MPKIKSITCGECLCYKAHRTPRCLHVPDVEGWNDFNCEYKALDPTKRKHPVYEKLHSNGGMSEGRIISTLKRQSARQGNGHR